jgi:WD40 repeat protein
LLSKSVDSVIRVWSYGDDYQCIKTIVNEMYTMKSTMFYLSGGYFAASSNKEIRLWDIKTYKRVNILEHDEAVIHAVLVSDNRIVSIAYDNKIIVWFY